MTLAVDSLPPPLQKMNLPPHVRMRDSLPFFGDNNLGSVQKLLNCSMKPKFKDMVAWHQAEMLMQPALIRIVDQVRKQLEQTSWKATYRDVQTPIPGYELCLENQNNSVCVDLWELCYQVCFRDYTPTHTPQESQDVEIDTNLIDETGDVDWQCLDTKAQRLVAQVFASLPSA